MGLSLVFDECWDLDTDRYIDVITGYRMAKDTDEPAGKPPRESVGKWLFLIAALVIGVVFS